MTEPTTPNAPFEPDWWLLIEQLRKKVVEDGTWSEAPARAVIAEYQRQLAAAGLVMVRREDLERIRNESSDRAVADTLNAILAATSATSGEDE
jgi:hypothetical protein